MRKDVENFDRNSFIMSNPNAHLRKSADNIQPNCPFCMLGSST